MKKRKWANRAKRYRMASPRIELGVRDYETLVLPLHQEALDGVPFRGVYIIVNNDMVGPVHPDDFTALIASPGPPMRVQSSGTRIAKGPHSSVRYQQALFQTVFRRALRLHKSAQLWSGSKKRK